MAAEVILYRLGCLIHWAPREQAIRRALRGLPAGVREGARLLDVGSGLGQLSRLARELGLDYLGLEPEDSLRRASSRDFPEARFIDKGASDLEESLGPADLLVLNGVAHHLNETLLKRTLDAARRARGLVLCDHLRLEGETHAFARWLQDRDQGKFVRPYEALRTLPDLELRSSEYFPIGPMGMRFWTYFCNVYTTS